MENPDIVNKCFDYLIENLENLEKQMVTRHNKKTKIKSPMNNIYETLTSTKLCDDQFMIDKWVLFIKSQGDFNKFY